MPPSTQLACSHVLHASDWSIQNVESVNRFHINIGPATDIKNEKAIDCVLSAAADGYFCQIELY
jgi:hypothetical protein